VLRRCALALALLALPARVGAAPADPDLSGPFDMEAAVAVALGKSPGLQAEGHRVRARELLAEAAARPEATRLTLDIWQVPLARPWALNESPMIMLGVRQPVPAAGSLRARAASLRKDAAADAASRDALAQDLATAVRHAFIDYAAAVARHAVHVEHRQVTERALAVARARQAVGGTLFDIARSETEVARAHADVATDATAITAARTRLNTLMARPADAPLGPPRDISPSTVDADARALIDRATQSRPETRAAGLRKDAASLELRAARREASLPSAMLGVAYFPATKPMPMHGYGLMVDLQLPWLTGQGRKRRDAQRELSAAAARDVAQVELTVAGEVSAALATVQAAAERWQALTTEARPAGERARAVALSGYETGRSDLLSLMAAQAVHVEIATDLIEARSTLDHALVDLDRAAGTPVPRRPLSQGAAAP
jgi:outer membrane protein TolC